MSLRDRIGIDVGRRIRLEDALEWAAGLADDRQQAPKNQFAPDSPLEGTGFEPSVPLLQKALLGVANRDVGTISGTT